MPESNQPGRLTRPQADFVARARSARLATVDRSGESYVVPVCYAWDGRRFYIPIDEKPKRRDRPLKRVRNIEETGRATLLVDHYEDADWSRLGWVMVRGDATMLGPQDDDHPRIITLLRERYRQYRAMRLEEAAIIALTPTQVTSWGALDLGDREEDSPP